MKLEGHLLFKKVTLFFRVNKISKVNLEFYYYLHKVFRTWWLRGASTTRRRQARIQSWWRRWSTRVRSCHLTRVEIDSGGEDFLERRRRTGSEGWGPDQLRGLLRGSKNPEPGHIWLPGPFQILLSSFLNSDFRQISN